MTTITKKATRESFGEQLALLGDKYSNLVVLDADLAGATKTSVFKNKFPDRHIDCGIAEADMTGVAAGLATCGKLPVISSFAMFAAGRNYEQIRNSICYPHLNVKIGATHAGITVGEDGATHQCVEDIALMRVLPGMTVIVPSDDVEARACLSAALELDGPVYMRFGRAAVPVINNNEDYVFEIGKAVNMRKGEDVVIYACGITVASALEAAELLEKEGISAEVVNVHTIKPIDREAVTESARGKKFVVTCEEHSIIGGLGGAVCEVLSETLPSRVLRIGINDTFGQSGKADELVRYYGLDGESIARRISEEYKAI